MPDTDELHAIASGTIRSSYRITTGIDGKQERRYPSFFTRVLQNECSKMSASTGVNMRVPTLKCLAADVIAGLVSGKEMVRLFEDLPDEPADIVLARYTTSTLRGAQGSASGVHHTPVARLLDFEAAQAACTLPEGVISRYTQRRSNALWEQVVRSDEESLSSAAARASSSNSY